MFILYTMNIGFMLPICYGWVVGWLAVEALYHKYFFNLYESA